jgi:hypothetical protein
MDPGTRPLSVRFVVETVDPVGSLDVVRAVVLNEVSLNSEEGGS